MQVHSSTLNMNEIKLEPGVSEVRVIRRSQRLMQSITMSRGGDKKGASRQQLQLQEEEIRVQTIIFPTENLCAVLEKGIQTRTETANKAINTFEKTTNKVINTFEKTANKAINTFENTFEKTANKAIDTFENTFEKTTNRTIDTFEATTKHAIEVLDKTAERLENSIFYLILWCTLIICLCVFGCFCMVNQIAEKVANIVVSALNRP